MMKTRHLTDKHRHRSNRHGATRTVDHSCSPRQACVRCSLMMVIRQRFTAFQRAFGRNPLPDEPLFFAENLPSPQKAGSEQVARQLAQAAAAASVPLPPLLKFLGLSAGDASTSVG
jgi:hypothetical protein